MRKIILPMFSLIVFSSSPVILLEKFFDSTVIKNDLQNSEITNFTNFNEKINLSNIKTKSVSMNLSTIENHTDEQIKNYVLLEIGEQNSSIYGVKEAIIEIVNFPNEWDIYGIEFKVPKKHSKVSYSAKFVPKDWNTKFYGYLNVNVELSNYMQDDVDKDVYIANGQKSAVGKAWGTGKANSSRMPATQEFSLDEFGGVNLFKENYNQIALSVHSEYYFKKGKKFNWDTYEKSKKDFYTTFTININNKNNMNEWNQVKKVESNEGGYKWGNYYNSWIKVEFTDEGKLKIYIDYEVSAYGVGANWYWTAGYIRATHIKFIGKN